MSILERDLTPEVSALKTALEEAANEHKWETELLVCLWLEGEEPEETLREARAAQDSTGRLIDELGKLERHMRYRLAQACAAKKKAEDLEENVLDIYPELRLTGDASEDSSGPTARGESTDGATYTCTGEVDQDESHG